MHLEVHPAAVSADLEEDLSVSLATLLLVPSDDERQREVHGARDGSARRHDVVRRAIVHLDGGPAHKASVKTGDLLVEVNGVKVKTLSELFRKVWQLGPPGTEIPLRLLRQGKVSEVRVRSGDRSDFLKKPQLQ
jgi:predicted metalloprotease with PDZ domain